MFDFWSTMILLEEEGAVEETEGNSCFWLGILLFMIRNSLEKQKIFDFLIIKEALNNRGNS